MKKTINVTQPALTPLKEFIPYLQKIWDHKIFANGGPILLQLEQALRDYLGVKHLALFSNGALALVTALQALRISGEFITAPYSFVATPKNAEALDQVYNIAVGNRTTLNELYAQLQSNLLPHYPHLKGSQPVYRDFRAGDVRHSLADIGKAQRLLGYAPTQRIGEGITLAISWYLQNEKASA